MVLLVPPNNPPPDGVEPKADPPIVFDVPKALLLLAVFVPKGDVVVLFADEPNILPPVFPALPDPNALLLDVPNALPPPNAPEPVFVLPLFPNIPPELFVLLPTPNGDAVVLEDPNGILVLAEEPPNPPNPEVDLPNIGYKFNDSKTLDLFVFQTLKKQIK